MAYINGKEILFSSVLSLVDDRYAKELKGTASGETVEITDVSPNEHDLKCKVASINLFDINSMINSSNGGYVIDGNTLRVYRHATYVTACAYEIAIPSGTQFWISCERSYGGEATSDYSFIRGVVGNTTDYDLINYGQVYTAGEEGKVKFYFARLGGNNDENGWAEYKNIQVEIGTLVTDFIPYVDVSTVKLIKNGTEEYTPNADGTVKGVTSTYPNITLATDTSGVIITCDYIKDLNKIIQKAQAPIISMIDRSATHIDIPEGVTVIGQYAFCTCASLTSVTISDTVTEIKARAFRECTKLASIKLPKMLEKIGNEAFRLCSACREYNFSECESIPKLGTDVFAGINANAKIIVPAKLYSEWVADTNWAPYSPYITTEV